MRFAIAIGFANGFMAKAIDAEKEQVMSRHFGALRDWRRADVSARHCDNSGVRLPWLGANGGAERNSRVAESEAVRLKHCLDQRRVAYLLRYLLETASGHAQLYPFLRQRGETEENYWPKSLVNALRRMKTGTNSAGVTSCEKTAECE
jgi:hypothetical protein